MENKLGQEPAFPTPDYILENSGILNFDPIGMSKRFYAACAAMQGMLAGNYNCNLVNTPTNNIEDGYPEPILIITQAYQFADELLRQENQ